MGRIVVSEFVTLDGVIEDPGGSEKSPYGGWAFRFDRGEDGDTFKFEELMTADALLLGRRDLRGPRRRVAEDGLRSVRSADERDAEVRGVLDADGRELEQQHDPAGQPGPGGDAAQGGCGEILVAGSGRLVSTLHEANLVDEYRLMVFPIVVGGGKSLFDGVGMPVSLCLAEARTAADTLLLRYLC